MLKPEELADKYYFRLTEEPLSLDRLMQAVTVPSAGAVATFAGVVRGSTAVGNLSVHTEYLVYEAYATMAHKQCQEIANMVFAQWPDVIRLAMEHRTGCCAVGEPTVLVAASSPHRGDGCFEACKFAIERLKTTVPIWKQENEADRQDWVKSPPDSNLNINSD